MSSNEKAATVRRVESFRKAYALATNKNASSMDVAQARNLVSGHPGHIVVIERTPEKNVRARRASEPQQFARAAMRKMIHDKPNE